MSVPSAVDAASNPDNPQIGHGRVDDATLERSLAAVEAKLQSLGEALLQRDLPAIDLESAGLHRSLASAIDHFSREARNGPIPPALRRRLASTGGQVAAQRESFARATAALDRAIDVLLPREAPPVYGAAGGRCRSPMGAAVEA